MKKEELKEYLQSEFEKKFSGWDFSYLKGRMEESPLPWNYGNFVENGFKTARVCLDMGTGGGEFLDSFEILPDQTYATEGYEPNIEIARQRLGRRNITVKAVKDDDILPFENDFFDLIINRHEGFKGSELFRTMKSGGRFISQQVGGLNDIDINSCLGHSELDYFDWCLIKAVKDLKDNGFKIIQSSENIGYTRFYDIGSIVYYLKCIPWQISDFSVEKYIDQLEILAWMIKENGYKDFICHRFMVIAERS
ncbi:MAG: methyltransferase domain-containing protein [Candidatus Riflebacteria bacterium]